MTNASYRTSLIWQPRSCSLSEPIMFPCLAVCQACTSHGRARPCLIGRTEAKQRLELYKLNILLNIIHQSWLSWIEEDNSLSGHLQGCFFFHFQTNTPCQVTVVSEKSTWCCLWRVIVPESLSQYLMKTKYWLICVFIAPRLQVCIRKMSTGILNLDCQSWHH